MQNLLKTAHITASEIISLTNTNFKTVIGSKDDRSHKRMDELNHDEDDEWKEFFFQHSIYICAESPLATMINVFQPLRLKLDVTQTTPPFSKPSFLTSLPMTNPLPLKKLYISSLMAQSNNHHQNITTIKSSCTTTSFTKL